MNPEFEDEEPLNPFDLWSGANFKLKIRKVEGYQNYDKSEFDAPSALLDDDDELESVWKKEYPLATFLERSNFKTYDEVKNRLNKVLALGSVGVAEKAPSKQDMWEEAPTARAVAPKAAPAKSVPKVDLPWDDQEDEDMAMFQRLADNN